MTITDVGDLGTILGVWAHPDDETYLSSAIMNRAVRNGQRVVCVTATKGELGIQDESRWPAAQLADIRERELMESLRILGVTEHRWLEYPDGGCDAVDSQAATARILDVIDEIAPDTVLTFGPDGQTGHPDHIAVCTWATDAVARSSSKPNLYYSTVTPEWWDVSGVLLDQFDVWFAGRPSITPEAELAVNVIPTPEESELKYQAISAQASQTESLLGAIGKEAFLQFSTQETYRHP